jgi:hypothetical protein
LPRPDMLDGRRYIVERHQHKRTRVRRQNAGLPRLRDLSEHLGQCVTSPGSRTVNTEPLPGSLATVTSPLIMRASLRERH